MEKRDYGIFVKGKASACTECAECEEMCPQRLPIRDELANAARVLES
jgi:predicted aldo/keto reductase-like oxidoreductase